MGKSSTAASVPTLRYEKTVVGGPANDKNKMRTLGGKNLINSVHRGLQGKSRAETSKKHRGERVKIEKENCHSSVESDSQSSNLSLCRGPKLSLAMGDKAKR